MHKKSLKIFLYVLTLGIQLKFTFCQLSWHRLHQAFSFKSDFLWKSSKNLQCILVRERLNWIIYGQGTRPTFNWDNLCAYPIMGHLTGLFRPKNNSPWREWLGVFLVCMYLLGYWGWEPTRSWLLADATEGLESNGIRHSRVLMEHNILLKVGMVHGVLNVSALAPSYSHKYISYTVSSMVNWERFEHQPCFFYYSSSPPAKHKVMEL